MPSLKFTQDSIESLKPPTKPRDYFWDSTTPGFGLRISAKGKKTWVVAYRINGKPIMETIGPISDIPTVKQARERAQKSRVAARDGVNPVAEKRAVKRAEKQAKQKPVTFGEIFDRYLRESCSRRLRPNSLRETDRMFRHDLQSSWGKRALADITRKDVKTLLEHKAAKRERPLKGFTGGAGTMANRHLSKLKTFFAWSVKEELITINPAIGIDKLVKEETRERVLKDVEIVALWHATEGLGFPYQQVTRLLLLTAQRRSEVAGMRWSEIENNEWTIPRQRAKNNKTHQVHLSPLALEIIESLPTKGGDMLFSPSGKSLTGFSQVKPKLDALMENVMRRKVEPWVFHDLRRTAATGMAQIGIAHHVLDRVLNHTSGKIDGIAKIYNRFEYLSERRDALNLWANHIEGLIKTKLKRAVL